jgi:hypothetical protein
MEEGKESSFYLLDGAALVILFCYFWSVYIHGIFPCVIAFRVSFPLDEILKAF